MFRRKPQLPVAPAKAAMLVALALGGVAAAGCKPAAPDLADNAGASMPAAPAPSSAAPMIPAPQPALTRSDLVSATTAAASEFAQGKAPASEDPLVGRSFAVRLPFGCEGPAPAESAQEASDGLPASMWGPDRATIRLRMTPGDWMQSAMLAGVNASEQWEAVEGFWVARPWVLAESCPTVKPDPLQTGAPPASPQTLGLAAVFETGGSRLGRRNGRAYEHVVRATGDSPLAPPLAGFRLLLEGQIAAFPSQQAIECRAPGPDQRPVCIVAVHLNRVAYKDADGKVLAEWRPG